jgi:hypothetical protein
VLVLADEPPGAARALRGLGGVRGVQTFRSPDGFPAFRLLGRSSDPSELCPAIYDLARDQGWPLRELRRDVRTLETVFNELATAA